MFGVLCKKQLAEIFRTWFFNPKTNKARSKVGTIGVILGFFLLVVVILGGMFLFVALSICGALSSAGMQWMYFSLFGLLATAFGLFGSVLNTYSSLYLAKDNDLLLSMPIPVGTIVASRLFSTYLMGALYSALVFLPAVIVSQIITGFDTAALVGGIVMALEISVLVWILSCLLGFAVARISLRLKRRSFVTVLASLAFIALYYFVYFRAQAMIQDLVNNAALYGTKIKGSAYVLYIWGKNGVGSLPDILLCLAACAILATVTWLILRDSFIRIATAAPREKKAAAAGKVQKVRSPAQALLAREFSRFTSSAHYMLNCGLGVLLIPAGGIAILVKGAALIAALPAELSQYVAAVPVGVAGIACLLASMNDSASPSVSLEGKSLWLIQSLPVEPWQIIRAKVTMQLILTELPMAIFCICVSAALPHTSPVTAFDLAMCIAVSMLYPVLSALLNMFIGLRMPMLSWSNEIVPIKQSGGVAIALFSGWGYAVLLVGGYFLLSGRLVTFSAARYLGLFALLTLAVSALLYRWLKTRGAEILRTL